MNAAPSGKPREDGGTDDASAPQEQPNADSRRTSMWSVAVEAYIWWFGLALTLFVAGVAMVVWIEQTNYPNETWDVKIFTIMERSTMVGLLAGIVSYFIVEGVRHTMVLAKITWDRYIEKRNRRRAEARAEGFAEGFEKGRAEGIREERERMSASASESDQ